jgi:hypothetical protein
MRGNFYIISNPQYLDNHMCKIGKTTSDEEDLKQRYRTYFTRPIILYFREVPGDYTFHESNLKSILQPYRIINDNGGFSEIVQMKPGDLIREVDKYFNYVIECACDNVIQKVNTDEDDSKHPQNVILSGWIKFLITYIEYEFGHAKLHAKDYNEKDTKGTVYRVKLGDLVSEFKAQGGAESTLKTQLRKLELEPKRLKTKGATSAVLCYELYPPDVEAKLKKYLKNKDFEFDYGTTDDEEEEEEEDGEDESDGNEFVEL